MNESKPLLILEGSCSDAAAWLIRLVSDAGLHVLRTFDLQDSRHAPARITAQASVIARWLCY